MGPVPWARISRPPPRDLEEEEDDDADLDELLNRTKEKRSQREMTKAVDELRQQEAWAEATDELKLHMWNCGGILTASWL